QLLGIDPGDGVEGAVSGDRAVGDQAVKVWLVVELVAVRLEVVVVSMACCLLTRRQPRKKKNASINAGVASEAPFGLCRTSNATSAQGTVGLLPGCRIPIASESLLMLERLSHDSPEGQAVSLEFWWEWNKRRLASIRC